MAKNEITINPLINPLSLTKYVGPRKKMYTGIPLFRFKICKQNHVSINHLTSSIHQVSTFILEKWVKKEHGQPKKYFLTKI